MKPRDITRRVLGRPMRSPYLPGGGMRRRRIGWWLLGGAWLAWIAFLSDHSLWRIARLRHELASARGDLARVQVETRRLDDQLHDPAARAEHGEEILRRQGMARPGEIVYRLGGAPDTLRR